MKKLKKHIFIFNQFFYPAYKAGGPLKSLKLIKEQLDKKLEIIVFTSSYDIDKKKIFNFKKKKNINNFDNFFYLILFLFNNFFFKKTHTTLYFNSFFNFKYTIIPLIFFKLFTKKNMIIIAPRGELFNTEIKKKFFKKIFYIFYFKLFLKKKITFHVTSTQERSAIKKFFPKNPIKYLPNLVEKNKKDFKYKYLSKPFKIVFLSRISPKKNLIKTLDILSKINLPIIFDIYGPIENINYWKKVKLKIRELKSINKLIKVSYKGTVKFNKYKILNRYNFFILLSDSENFGHSIFESIISKCFPIVTKNSPWKIINKLKCGLLIDPMDKKASKKIEHFINKTQKNSSIMQNKLKQIIKKTYLDQKKIKYEKLFS
jgi:hypothetical protein